MDVHDLNGFLAVAEELHFGRAAERLHMGQPPLTRMIQHLERDLGQRLFDRTTRTVRLTNAGAALIEPARDVQEALRAARRAVQAAGRGETGRVRVGFAGPSSHVLIGELGRQVRQAQPGIELSLQSTTYGPGALRAVVDGSLDLAVVRWDGVSPPEVADRIVTVEHYVLVVPEAHRLASRTLVSMRDCRDEPFIALPGDPGSWVRDALIRTANEAGYAPDIVQVAPDSWTVMALVAAGAGITFSVDAAMDNVVQRGIRVLPLEEGRIPIYSRLIWRRDDKNPALREVLRVSEGALPSPPM